MRYPEPGDHIDAYRVVRRLGEGGMGVVLLARDERLAREVAIKLIRREHMTRPEARARFEAEARVMARVRHPNVVEIYAFGELDGAPYFVMEYVPGCDLETFMKKRGAPLSLGEAHGILDRICLGAEAIHRAGAAHRDLKPSNVLIGDSFRVAISDFGVARLADSGPIASDSLTGTPAFMAPEVIAGHSTSLASLVIADVFSIGVMAYQLFTGELPFEGADLPQMLTLQLTGTPLRPCERRADLPPAFEQAILSSTARDPRARPQSAEALRQLFEAAWRAERVPSTSLRFLVADDDPGFRSLISVTLAKAFPAATIEAVGDGEAALAAARVHPPSLVVSDLDMPGLNGIELTAALRADPRQADVPIVVATAVGGATDWKVLAGLGADGFLVKPFDASLLIGMVEGLLSQHAAWKPGKHKIG